MSVSRRLPVFGHLRLLAIMLTIAGLMTPSFPSTGPEKLEPRASTDLAWNVIDTDQVDPLAEYEDYEVFEFPAEPAEPVADESTETSEPDEDSINLNESALGLFVSGARRPLSSPASRLSSSLPRVASKAPTHARSGRDFSALALDLPTRLCRLTC